MFSRTTLQILGTSDLQDTTKEQEVLENENAFRTNEHESTTHDTPSISSMVTASDFSQRDSYRSDGKEIGDDEKGASTNESVKIEKNDNTVEDSLEHEPTANEDSEEWNCTIQ